jgi:hypothetical protein
MSTVEMERRSCLASAERWRRQAEHIRTHAARSYLKPDQRGALLTEAEACDRQADWWLDGADAYPATAAAIELEMTLQ